MFWLASQQKTFCVITFCMAGLSIMSTSKSLTSMPVSSLRRSITFLLEFRKLSRIATWKKSHGDSTNQPKLIYYQLFLTKNRNHFLRFTIFHKMIFDCLIQRHQKTFLKKYKKQWNIMRTMVNNCPFVVILFHLLQFLCYLIAGFVELHNGMAADVACTTRA